MEILDLNEEFLFMHVQPLYKCWSHLRYQLGQPVRKDECHDETCIFTRLVISYDSYDIMQIAGRQRVDKVIGEKVGGSEVRGHAYAVT